MPFACSHSATCTPISRGDSTDLGAFAVRKQERAPRKVCACQGSFVYSSVRHDRLLLLFSRKPVNTASFPLQTYENLHGSFRRCVIPLRMVFRVCGSQLYQAL